MLAYVCVCACVYTWALECLHIEWLCLIEDANNNGEVSNELRQLISCFFYVIVTTIMPYKIMCLVVEGILHILSKLYAFENIHRLAQATTFVVTSFVGCNSIYFRDTLKINECNPMGDS